MSKQFKCGKCKDSGIVSDGGLQLVCAIQGKPIPRLRYYPCVECNLEGYKKVADCYSAYQTEVDDLRDELNTLKEEHNKDRIVGEVLSIVDKRIHSLQEELEDYDG